MNSGSFTFLLPCFKLSKAGHKSVKFFNPRTYTQIHTRTVVQEGGRGRGGGWMEPLPGVFDLMQYFEKILPLVGSL